jgi:hypothetical protein
MRAWQRIHSARWAVNCVHFPLAMLAYNPNGWLMLLHREKHARTVDLDPTPSWRRLVWVVLGGQNRAARRRRACALQRSLLGEGIDGATHGWAS